MKLVEFPVPTNEPWKLEQEFDNLKFDIQSARIIADRLRFKNAEKALAGKVARENLENTLIHLGSLIAFLTEVKDEMEGRDEPHEKIPDHIRQTWSTF